MMNNKLTRREKEIFIYLLDGLIPKEIAGKLKISYDTVVSHQKKLYRKLDVHSIEELVEKYQNKKEEIVSPTNGKKQFLPYNLIKPKYLIAAGIAIVILIIIFILLQRCKSAEEPLDTRIYLEDGTYFTGHTFETIYMNANKWVNIEGAFYGEQYTTNSQIYLSDIYSGTFDDLIGDSNFIKLRVSGTIDKECKMTVIHLHYVYQDEWYYELQGKWYVSSAHSVDKPVKIGPGIFSEIFTLRRDFSDTLPEGGYFVVAISNTLLTYHDGWVVDSGDRLPPDMPNGAICATINNLKIEPVNKLAK